MAVDIFLKLSNGIKGESDDSVHKGAIRIESWAWGLSQTGNMHVGSGGGSGKVSVQDLSLSKQVDMSSTALAARCASGAHIDSAELIVREAGGDAPVEYLKIKMENVLVASYSAGAHKDADARRMSDNFTLHFRKYAITYQMQDNSGAGGSSETVGWDIAANATWAG